MNVAGVQVKAGTVFIVVATRPTPGELVEFVDSARLIPNEGLGEAEQLADLQARLVTHLRPHDVRRIGMLHTRQFGNWSYTHAFARISSVCAVMGAATTLHVPFKTHTTNHVAKSLNLDAAKLETLAPEALGLSLRPTYWRAGLAEAASVAAHCAQA